MRLYLNYLPPLEEVLGALLGALDLVVPILLPLLLELLELELNPEFVLLAGVLILLLGAGVD